MNAQNMANAIREKSERLISREPRHHDDSDNAELLLVLARLIEGKTLEKSFGAPGDWGYSNPIGKILAGK